MNMPTNSAPENRIACCVDVMIDGSILVGPTDGSHAYAIALTPSQLRELAIDLWTVAERLQPLIESTPGVAITADEMGVVAWN